MPASINELAALPPGLALTLVLPTEPTGPNRALTSHVTRLLAEAHDKIRELAGEGTAVAYVERVRRAIDGLDRRYLSTGVWVGATADEVMVHHLDDPVEASLHVGDSLDLLPLVRQSRRTDALVLVVSEPRTDLMRWRPGAPTAVERLTSLNAPGFPVEFSGEGGRPARDAGDRQRDERYRHWLRGVAAAVPTARREVPAVADLPLIVVGIGRYIGFLTEVAPDFPVDAVVEGSPDAFNAEDLDRAIGEAAEEFAESASYAALDRIQRSAGTGRSTTDAAEIGVCAAAGRIATLVVEVDDEDPDLLSVAQEVWAHGGQVHVMSAGLVSSALGGQIPVTRAALLRW
jgi:hypothetical protein